MIWIFILAGLGIAVYLNILAESRANKQVDEDLETIQTLLNETQNHNTIAKTRDIEDDLVNSIIERAKSIGWLKVGENGERWVPHAFIEEYTKLVITRVVDGIKEA